MITINLIPKEYIERQKKAVIGKLGFIAAGLLVIIVGSVSLVLIFRARSLAGQVASLEARVKQLEEVAREVDTLEAKKRAIEAKNAVVTSLLIERLNYPKVMEALIRSLPPNQIWWNSMTTKKTADGYDISLQASALSVDAVIRWLERLETSSGFSNIKLGAIAAASNGSASFPITFTCKP